MLVLMSTRTYAEPNAEAIEAWDTVLFDKFSKFRHLVSDGLGGHGVVALDRHPPAEGARVLDVGCGFGDTTLDLARRVGARGEAVGVDGSARFVESARRSAQSAGVANARFFEGDVQRCDLGGPFDHAFARFGTMFFANPVAALRNVRGALREGGLFCMVVWRRREDNPWICFAEEIVRPIVPVPEEHDAPTCGPGPFSMAGADTVTDQMLAAAFREVALERVDLPICIGKDADEAVDFALSLGPAGEIMRLAGEEGERQRPVIEKALRERFAERAEPAGIFAGSSAWVVTGRA
jgi:ubiquinone/menaquinone biosynthesis C-methylase UbiE